MTTNRRIDPARRITRLRHRIYIDAPDVFDESTWTRRCRACDWIGNRRESHPPVPFADMYETNDDAMAS